ncbi:MAG: nucleotidyltransferase domain-containing protein [Candidatus Diapherotrites archaeon]|nr:nucleotidyltransferase domain-containing protein [Candidatus Diapherotrites archaeon]
MDVEDAVRKILEVGGEKVLFIVLYGSQARGDARKDSDIDLAVYYEGDRRERFAFRQRVLGELSDYVDVQTIQDLPLYVVHRALREGRIVYERDKGKTIREILRLSRDAEEFMHRLAVVLGEA